MKLGNLWRLLSIALLLTSVSVVYAGQRFALVIGNGAYFPEQSGVNDLGILNNPPYDAKDMADLLKQFGFTLVDDKGRNQPLIDANKQQMDDAIDKFIAILQKNPDAEAWFYYSGHGVYLKDKNRPTESANYLLPIGNKYLASNPAFIKYNAINAHLLKERLEDVPLKNRLMFLDTCRNRLELSESKGYSGGEEFRPMDADLGLLVVYATLHSYSSFGLGKERNSRFTKYLLSALRSQSNQLVTVSVSQAIGEVLKLNRELPDAYQQIPRVEGILDGSFCLGECGSNQSSVTIPEPPVPVRPESLPKTITNSIGMEFVLIPAGSFMMGSNVGYNDEKPVHSVTIEKPFYMGKYEVTQAQWKAVMGNNPALFSGDNLPVERVSWQDAQVFIRKLNAKEGKDKYRLPTEAEWEYSAMGGSSAKWHFGNNESELKNYAWYWDNSDKKTHPVGQKYSNQYGLYDMVGNVWEWTCSDYESYGSGKEQVCSEKANENKSLRGGSWYYYANSIRSAFRSGYAPTGKVNDIGFRLVLLSP